MIPVSFKTHRVSINDFSFRKGDSLQAADRAGGGNGVQHQHLQRGVAQQQLVREQPAPPQAEEDAGAYSH
jgi:hypothetical protein